MPIRIVTGKQFKEILKSLIAVELDNGIYRLLVRKNNLSLIYNFETKGDCFILERIYEDDPKGEIF